MMIKKQIILVICASCGQDSVAHALLTQTNFIVRVFTTDAKSENAIELQRAGAEIVQGDLNDIDSLVKAMKECYAVFSNTYSWQYFNNKQQLLATNDIPAVRDIDLKYSSEMHYLTIQN